MSDHLVPEPIDAYKDDALTSFASKPAAAAILLREAKIAVQLMQERGVGMNETGLAAAILECEAAGISPAPLGPKSPPAAISASLKDFGKVKG